MCNTAWEIHKTIMLCSNLHACTWECMCITLHLQIHTKRAYTSHIVAFCLMLSSTIISNSCPDLSF